MEWTPCFFWPRIWLKLDKDVREDIDSRQAIVDSTVYVSFACFIGGALWLIYGLFGIANALTVSWRGTAIFTFSHTLFEHLPSLWMTWLWAAIFFLLGFVVYRNSLRLHAQFGEVFKSVFDVFHDLPVTSVIGDIVEYSGDQSLSKQSRRERLEAAFGYLQFGLINCPICGKRISYSKIKDHLGSHQNDESAPEANGS